MDAKIYTILPMLNALRVTVPQEMTCTMYEAVKLGTAAIKKLQDENGKLRREKTRLKRHVHVQEPLDFSSREG